MEYKAWLVLNDDEARAKVARDLCAMANRGGYLVFGIDDGMTQSGVRPHRAIRNDQDTLSSSTVIFCRRFR